jgi:hypothetical protein
MSSNTVIPYDDPEVCVKARVAKDKKSMVNDEAKHKCEELTARLAEIKRDTDIMEGINKMTTNAECIFAPWVCLIDKIPGKNTLQNNVINTIKQNITSSLTTDVANICKSSSDINQTNEIVTSEKCVEALQQPCSLLKDDNLKLKCLVDAKNSLSISNVTQKNKANDTKNCVIMTSIQELTKNSNDATLQAVIKAVQEASGFGTSNDSNTLNCNNISSDISADQYTNAVSCCLNKTVVNQKNLVNTCGYTNKILQDNDSNSFQKCMQSNNIIKTTDNENKAQIDSLIDSLQKVDTTTSAMAGGISCLFCICSVIMIGLMISGNSSDE